jgi:hypothetical protein
MHSVRVSSVTIAIGVRGRHLLTVLDAQQVDRGDEAAVDPHHGVMVALEPARIACEQVPAVRAHRHMPFRRLVLCETAPAIGLRDRRRPGLQRERGRQHEHSA